MKILTILIFSGDDRLNIKYLLRDISLLNKSNTNIRIVEWGEDKKILIKKKRIYQTFKKKIKNLKIYYQKGNWEYKYSRLINKFNSKYILLIGDDDRVNLTNFKKIYKYLNYNFTGITLSFTNFKTNKDLNFISSDTIDRIRPFDLTKDFNRIGFTSCQIMNLKLLKKIFKTEQKYLLKTKFPQNFIITKLIVKYSNWYSSDLSCIFNNLRSFDKIWIKKNLMTRLKSEYDGYFIPLKKNFLNHNSKKINKIYKNIFFKNIISWLFLSLKYFGKTKTFKNIKKERKILKEPLLVKLILLIIYLSPIFLLDILRIIRRKILLKV